MTNIQDRYLLILCLSIFSFLIFQSPANSGQPGSGDSGKRFAKLGYESETEKNGIAGSGIDIWEAGEGWFLVYATEAELSASGMDIYVTEYVDNEIDYLIKYIKDVNVLDDVDYRDLAGVNDALFALESSGIAKVFTIGQSIQNRPIYAVKISRNPDENEGKPSILFCGTHHAREWISTEVPLRLAEYLVNSYPSDVRVQNIVDNGEIWVVPMVNPDGYLHTWTTYRLWRKNRRFNSDGSYGVDLNRNYGYMWGGAGSSGIPTSEIYRGTSAFSEPETQALRDLILNNSFHSVLSYHSYSQLVLYPWGHTTSPAPHSGMFDMMATEMADLIFWVHGFTYVPQQSSGLYITTGDTCDWAYGVAGLPAFTIELRPSSFSGGGFELPASQIIATFEENIPAALFLIEWTQNIVDQDLDSLPDCWEYFKLGGLMYNSDDDPDDDGRTNYEEYHAGTDPHDPDSYFAVIRVSGRDAPEIEWFSVYGRKYDIWFADEEYDNGMIWQIAESSLPAGNGDTTTWIDDGTHTGLPPSHPSVHRRFYRVSVNAGL